MVQYPSKLGGRRQIGRASIRSEANFANRGMSFEKMLNETNSYYLTKGRAVIHKKPTPVQIVRVDYPQRSRAKIVEAYFRQASTTDYSGVYKGYYLDFEAKETRQKTGMPLKNFHAHQIDHMRQVLEQDGICFALLHFSTLQETFLLPAEALIQSFQEDWKSLPIEFIREQGYSISLGAFPSVPYLEIIEEHLIGGNSK
ncbi:Holliday junction resolvase RecU [Streptococcus danieliae]|uniref:Holliday junction resolvase RecU n=1 Tax=Streptococcus danieliae TaxID=747656 RepID=A0A7Z0M4X0_9STRE|nr:Holliday junction resolvase RecU [Streptococcus danieliae]MBF0698740.1 Holliday junction resolvase RecU [Streptococcus danieliae]NYS95917.1 Holliday junction resolvase RecU [Streptococcus danieliae]